jgi:hypothetical protein
LYLTHARSSYCWEMRCRSVCVPHHVLHWYQESCL